MSDDIPQDQVEAVARALLAKDWEKCPDEILPPELWKAYVPDAIAAIRVLTPMIAEQCAEIADAYATAARAYAPEDKEETHVSAARAIAFDIRSVTEGERCAALNPIPILAAPISRLMELDQASVFALADIAAERVRQIEGEAWSVHHDDRHNTGEMARAAACYALIERGHKMKERASLLWPWDLSWFKPGSPHRNWIRAGALLVSELARHLRSAESTRSVKGAVT